MNSLPPRRICQGDCVVTEESFDSIVETIALLESGRDETNNIEETEKTQETSHLWTYLEMNMYRTQ